MRPSLRQNGEGRAFRKVPELSNVPSTYHDVRYRIQEAMNLGPDARPEPMFGWYLSIISAGGAIHVHTDPSRPNRRHLRCNLFIQLPEQGGHPIIEDHVQVVRERSLLAFFPSERRHASEPVHGSRWRVVCSFGYLVFNSYELLIRRGTEKNDTFLE
jgi:hypothetical protein